MLRFPICLLIVIIFFLTSLNIYMCVCECVFNSLPMLKMPTLKCLCAQLNIRAHLKSVSIGYFFLLSVSHTFLIFSRSCTVFSNSTRFRKYSGFCYFLNSFFFSHLVIRMVLNCGVSCPCGVWSPISLLGFYLF